MRTRDLEDAMAAIAVGGRPASKVEKVKAVEERHRAAR
jgi:hypothetical protein